MSRRLQEAVLLGDREDTKTRGRSLGTKRPALLLGSQQGPQGQTGVDQQQGLAELKEVPCAWSQSQNSGGWVQRTEETNNWKTAFQQLGTERGVRAEQDPRCQQRLTPGMEKGYAWAPGAVWALLAP